MSNKKYISTTLPYANSSAHIGHTFEFVLADVIARYYRDKLGKENVFFNTGIDEHGLKIQKAAEAVNLPLQQYCDFYANSWKYFCKLLQIDYDNFYRTTDSLHKELTKNYFEFLIKNPEITSKHEYKGKYCIGCESFITEKEIVDNKCPIHHTELQDLSEENWFFNLAHFRPLIENILANKNLSLELEHTIEDFNEISITRQNVSWGVKVDDKTTLYVWFEALLNYYLSLADKPHNEVIEYWKNSTIICGKDNLKFQAYILQALNLALDIPQNKEILVHGTILDEQGKKMSKSVGNVIDPLDQLVAFGVSPLRAYLFLGLNIFGDSNYNELALKNLWNNTFVDGFGNLIARVLHLIDIKKVDTNVLSDDYKLKLFEFETTLQISFENHQYNAFNSILTAEIFRLNKRINEEKPYSKECLNASEVLSEIYHSLILLSKYIKFIIPEYADALDIAFEEKKKAIIFKKID